MTTTSNGLALMVQIEERHGSYRAVARVVLPQENGELQTPSWRGYGQNFDSGDDGQRFDGLEITAYTGDQFGNTSGDLADKLWGFGVHYAPYRIENSTHAKVIAKVFGQIERGMAKLEAEDGYIREGEFARYVMRVAKALRIRRVYARNVPRAYAMTGERYRLADATALEFWCQEVTEKIIVHELSTLTR